MKKFTKQEIMELYAKVMMDEMTFSQMTKVLNERVSEEDKPNFKDGDFVVNVCGVVIIFKNKVESYIYDHAYFSELAGVISFSNLPTLSPIKRYATEEEKKKMLNVLEKKGKRWNEEKKCIEDIPKFKNGDFLVGLGCIFILHKQIDEYSAQYHVLYAKTNGMLWYGKIYWQTENITKLRLATDAEKQELIDTLTKEGKRWNAEKLCVEDIPKRKFKKGDKVRIKHGISSKTHCSIGPGFVEDMDDLIGKTITVDRYIDWHNYVECEGICCYFLEEWLEPYVEQPKKGDLAIFWDDRKRDAIIKFYERANEGEEYFRHKDRNRINWKNAVKFESKKQYERLIKGEI